MKKLLAVIMATFAIMVFTGQGCFQSATVEDADTEEVVEETATLEETGDAEVADEEAAE